MSELSFSIRLRANLQAHGPLCVGIDPSAPTLRACGLPDSAEGALAFGQLVLGAGEGRLAIVKSQSAYFERFGSAGWRALETLIVAARARGVLVLLDAKRDDIDSTAEAYAHAFLWRPLVKGKWRFSCLSTSFLLQ
jgi:orotidine-5'-phosphate decarboxylase